MKLLELLVRRFGIVIWGRGVGLLKAIGSD